MKCLRCGYCCIKYMVVIVDDPALGLAEDNLIIKNTDEWCKHLVGNKPGEYSCAIHDYPWYDQTPCWQYTQVELSLDDPCRTGEWMLEHKDYHKLLTRGD